MNCQRSLPSETPHKHLTLASGKLPALLGSLGHVLPPLFVGDFAQHGLKVLIANLAKEDLHFRNSLFQPPCQFPLCNVQGELVPRRPSVRPPGESARRVRGEAGGDSRERIVAGTIKRVVRLDRISIRKERDSCCVSAGCTSRPSSVGSASSTHRPKAPGRLTTCQRRGN